MTAARSLSPAPTAAAAAPKPHAVVIGAGFGGLAAAIRLGARGYRVTVVDNRDKPGGRAYVYEQDGFVWDAGPTVITAPWLLEELWTLCGKQMADDIEMRAVDPYYAVRFDDGTDFRYSGDPEVMRQEIQKLAPADLAGWERFGALSKRIFKVGFEDLADVPFLRFSDMLKIAPAMLRLQSYRTVYGLVSKYVKNEKLRQVLSFHTLLVGGNPFSTTSIYALIYALERKWGVHFPKGGTHAVVRGLVALLEGQGNSLRLGTEVDEILVAGRRATGVRLKNGETLAADIVVSNADAARTYKHLLPARHRKRWTDRKIENTKYSMSLFVWYFGTQGRYEHVKQHTILMGPRYKALLDDIFDRQVLADDFSLYLHRPTATDPSLAPAGCDAFYALSPVPHLKAGIDWQAQAEPYRRRIAQYLEQSLLPGLSQKVVASHMITPVTFQRDMLSLYGAAFGIQPVLTQSAWFRPHNQSEELDNLYLVGASTHPGAGIPGVLSSARVLDRLIPAVQVAARNP